MKEIRKHMKINQTPGFSLLLLSATIVKDAHIFSFNRLAIANAWANYNNYVSPNITCGTTGDSGKGSVIIDVFITF